MVSMPAKSLFKLYAKDRRLLCVTKTPQLQTFKDKEWWPDVEYIAVKHFDSYDDLEFAKAEALALIGKESDHST